MCAGKEYEVRSRTGIERKSSIEHLRHETVVMRCKSQRSKGRYIVSLLRDILRISRWSHEA
jgi:hypothetical protein